MSAIDVDALQTAIRMPFHEPKATQVGLGDLDGFTADWNLLNAVLVYSNEGTQAHRGVGEESHVPVCILFTLARVENFVYVYGLHTSHESKSRLGGTTIVIFGHSDAKYSCSKHLHLLGRTAPKSSVKWFDNCAIVFSLVSIGCVRREGIFVVRAR